MFGRKRKTKVLTIENIARVCHQVNKAYCESLGDKSQVDWEDAPEWQKESAREGVMFHLLNPDSDPSDSHKSWRIKKAADGWKYGANKSEEHKTHPCMVAFSSLPKEQQAKDFLFLSVVRSLEGLEL